MDNYIVLDIETTGISPDFEEITEIGAARIVNNEVVATFSSLVKPSKIIPPNIVMLTGITNAMVAEAPTIARVLPEFLDFCGDDPILGHNVNFDYSFLKTAAVRHSLRFEKKGLDTLTLARKILTDQQSYSLTNLIACLGIQRENAHRGLDDALATHELYQLMRQRCQSAEALKLFRPYPFAYKPKKQSPITPRQVTFLMDLIKRYKVDIDYEVKDLSKSDASKKIDGILNTYGKPKN